MLITQCSAFEISSQIRERKISAEKVIKAHLDRIRELDPTLNCFTKVLEKEALNEALALDAKIAAGGNVGELAGVPFAVKDLFDVAGLPTTAGARMRELTAPVKEDAVCVSALRSAGAILIGTLNMDEFAYGFATVNAHFGTTKNPHDMQRLAGGSSGGSAGAVCAGLVPISLGSDTNGSVRVPASLCGVYGLRPTHGSISEEGVYPFVKSLDTVGVFARSADDIELVFEVINQNEIDAVVPEKIGVLSGWFDGQSDPELLAELHAFAECIGATEFVDIPLAEAARSAGFVETAAEGGRLHLSGLQSDAMGYDPAVRSRLIAGVLLPDSVLNDAKQVGALFKQKVLEKFSEFDVLIALSTPVCAPLISENDIKIRGKQVSARANLGTLCQPISQAGVPVLSVPLKRKSGLPIGIQLIASIGQEAKLLAFAKSLEARGLIGQPMPSMEEMPSC